METLKALWGKVTAFTTGNKWLDSLIVIALGAYLIYLATGILYWVALAALVLVVLSGGTSALKEYLAKARAVAEQVVDTVENIVDTKKTIENAEKAVKEAAEENKK